MKPYEICSEKAFEVHKEIKKLNKILSKVRGQEKKSLDQQIKDKKDQWWEDIKYLMVKR